MLIFNSVPGVCTREGGIGLLNTQFRRESKAGAKNREKKEQLAKTARWSEGCD